MHKLNYMTLEITLDRKSQIAVGGSLVLSFAPQVLLDKEKYLHHVNKLLNDNPHSNLNKKAHLQYFYESFVISLLSYLEYITGDACDEIALVINQKIKIKDINERSKFEASEKYLKLLIDEQFPSNNVKSQLRHYRKVRNLLVHGAGLYPRNEKEIKIIRGMKGITEEDEIFYLTKEFCDAMLRFSAQYINELTVIALTVSEKAALFLKKS